MTIRSDALFSRLLSDLAVIGVSQDTSPTAWSSYSEVAGCLLRDAFYKKFVDRTSPDADSRALDKFKAVNERCRSWEPPELSSWDEELVGCLKKVLYEFFTPYGESWSLEPVNPEDKDTLWCRLIPGRYPLINSFEQILQSAYTGPGASLGANGMDFYTKMFSSPLTTTSAGLYKAYSSYVKRFPLWADAEEFRRAQFGEARVVEGNKLHFVPKRVDISRLICIEPSLNMFFQLGLKEILEARIRQFFGIDFSVQQDRSRELARRGSCSSSSNALCTLDLESASDSISRKMLKWILPSEAFAWFDLFRSPRAMVPGSSEPMELHMISTMGNGTTFPLQTIIFSSIIFAAASFRKYPLVRYGKIDTDSYSSIGNFSVYGDDMVVPKPLLKDVLRLLELLGFSVNAEKSFVEGPFRESCGGDFYEGRPVRPVYVKSLSSQQDRYALINRLNEWSAMTGIPLPRTVQYLLSTVRFQPVPLYENAEAGIRVPYDPNWRYDRCEKTGSIKYRRSIPRLNRILIGEAEFKYPRGAKKRIYNPEGLYVSFLQGCIVSASINVRHDVTRFATKSAVTPYWDYLPLGKYKYYDRDMLVRAMFYNFYCEPIEIGSHEVVDVAHADPEPS